MSYREGRFWQPDVTVATVVVDGGRLPPRNLMAWVAFGGLSQRLDQPKLTERIINEVVRRFPGEPRVGLLRVTQLRDDGKSEEAAQLLEQTLEEEKKTDALLTEIADGLVYERAEAA